MFFELVIKTTSDCRVYNREKKRVNQVILNLKNYKLYHRKLAKMIIFIYKVQTQNRDPAILLPDQQKSCETILLACNLSKINATHDAFFVVFF